MENELMVLEEVAKYLHCSPDAIRVWRRTKNFPYIKISHRCVRYRKHEIDDWLDNMALSRETKIEPSLH